MFENAEGVRGDDDLLAALEKALFWLVSVVASTAEAGSSKALRAAERQQ